MKSAPEGDTVRRRKGPWPFHHWLALQTHHTEQPQREAAEYIAGRWSLDEKYKHARVLRVLKAERNQHLAGAQVLADEYIAQEALSPDEADQAEVRLSISNSLAPLRPEGVEECQHFYSNGRVCGRPAIPLTGKCAQHGGQWINPEDYDAISRTVRDHVIELSGRAVATVEFLMDHARSEKVRLEAAQTVMRTVGLDPGVRGEGVMTQAANGHREMAQADTALVQVKQRLALLRERTLEATAETGAETETVEAEVVDD